MITHPFKSPADIILQQVHFTLGKPYSSTKVISWLSGLPSVLTNLCIKHESLLTVLIEFISIRFICPSDFGMHPCHVSIELIKGERFTPIQQDLSTGGCPLRLIENKVIFISTFHSWSLIILSFFTKTY